MKRLALITGASGLIGSYLVRNASRWAPGWAVQGPTRTEFDLGDASAISSAFQRYNPDLVIHCAAMSRTKDCEQDPATAERINVAATALLSHLARKHRFIFVSSGEVFDGSTGWYAEDAQPNPINVYGRTKLAAERKVLENASHTVVRIVLTAGTSENRDRSFVEDMSRTVKSGQSLTLYGDEFRCPLPAGAVARALWELAEQDKPGLYHLGGSERLSRRRVVEAQAVAGVQQSAAACCALDRHLEEHVLGLEVVLEAAAQVRELEIPGDRLIGLAPPLSHGRSLRTCFVG